MPEKREELQAIADRLRQERDELRVQLNLAKKEARDEWEQLEGKWDRLRGRLKVVQDEVEDASEEALTAASMLAEEIKAGYQRIKDLI